MSRPFQPSGIAPAAHDARLGVGGDRPARSRRRSGSAPARSRAGGGTRRPCRARTSESPTRDALREQERERHRPADEHRVAAVEQRVDHAELVAHLGAAEHRDERVASASCEQPRQHLDLAVQQPPAGAAAGRAAGRRSTRARGATRRTPRSRSASPSSVRLAANAGRRRSRPARSAGSRASRRRPARRLADQRLDRRARRPPAPAAPSTPSSSPRRAATGAIEYCGSSAPFGPPEVPARRRRPRRARAATAIVGSAVVMRRSSSIAPSRSGTLKSTRTSTRVAALERAGPRGVGGQRSRRAGVGATRRRRRRGRRGGSSSPTRCRTSRAP